MDASGQLTYDDILGWLRRYTATIAENKQYLTELDSAIGDADHGINMDRGFQAAMPKLEALPGGDVGAALKSVGMTLISTVGGASGPLYGTFFLQLGGATAGRESVPLQDMLTGLENGVAGIQRLGKAEAGDKTMLDTLLPARDALKAALDGGRSPSDAIAETLAAAKQGMESTTPLVARKGRASYLGERSAGHQDPGATSSYLLLKAASEAWTGSA